MKKKPRTVQLVEFTATKGDDMAKLNLNELKEGHEAFQTRDRCEDLKDKTESVVDKLAHDACNLYNQSKEKINEVEEKLAEYSENVANYVKEKPLSFWILAGGVGLLVAKLLKK